MTHPSSEPPGPLRSTYVAVLRAIDTPAGTSRADDDRLADVLNSTLPLPDGRVLEVGDWSAADLRSVRRALGLPTDRPIPGVRR